MLGQGLTKGSARARSHQGGVLGQGLTKVGQGLTKIYSTLLAAQVLMAGLLTSLNNWNSHDVETLCDIY